MTERRIKSPSEFVESDPNLFKSGDLLKLGAVFKSWKRRYFVLDKRNKLLLYYSNDKDIFPNGIIDLEEYCIIEPDDDDDERNTNNGFRLKSKSKLLTRTRSRTKMKSPTSTIRERLEDKNEERVYYLRAPSPEEKIAWMRELVNVCSDVYVEENKLSVKFICDKEEPNISYPFCRYTVSKGEDFEVAFISVEDLVAPDSTYPLKNGNSSTLGFVVVPKGLTLTAFCVNLPIVESTKKAVLQFGDLKTVIVGDGTPFELKPKQKTPLSPFMRYSAFVIEQTNGIKLNWEEEITKATIEGPRSEAKSALVGSFVCQFRMEQTEDNLINWNFKFNKLQLSKYAPENNCTPRFYIAVNSLPFSNGTCLFSESEVEGFNPRFEDEISIRGFSKNGSLCFTVWDSQGDKKIFCGYCSLNLSSFKTDSGLKRFPLHPKPVAVEIETRPRKDMVSHPNHFAERLEEMLGLRLGFSGLKGIQLISESLTEDI